MSAKTPACHDETLRSLYTVIEALKRSAFIEAIKHVGDCAANIQNEREWCYDTDETLTAMHAFMTELGDAIGVLSLLHRGGEEQRALNKELIHHINSTINDVAQVSKGQSHWQNPDTNLDLLETEYRVQKYRG